MGPYYGHKPQTQMLVEYTLMTCNMFDGNLTCRVMFSLKRGDTMNYMNKSSYETRTLRILRMIEEDLANNRLTAEEFEILIGFLIEKEFSDNLKHQISRVVPKSKSRRRGFSWINYELKRSHAS